MNEVPQDSSLSHWNQLAKLEFENLYKEIEQNAKNVFLVINIRYCELNGNHRCSAYIEAASAPTIIPLMFLLPLAVIIPSMMLIASQLNSTARISAYLRLYHETGVPGVQWQGAIQELRRLDTDRTRKTSSATSQKPSEPSPPESRPKIWKSVRNSLLERLSKLFGVRRRFLVRSLISLLPLLCIICIVSAISLALLLCQMNITQVILYVISYAFLILFTLLFAQHIFMSFRNERFNNYLDDLKTLRKTGRLQ